MHSRRVVEVEQYLSQWDVTGDGPDNRRGDLVLLDPVPHLHGVFYFWNLVDDQACVFARVAAWTLVLVAIGMLVYRPHF